MTAKRQQCPICGEPLSEAQASIYRDTTDLKVGATPGPWTCRQGQCDGKPETWWDVDGAPEAHPEGDSAITFPQPVCMVYGHNGAAEANARLIAAAPELLEALRLICDSGVALSDMVTDKMVAAIAKAEGAK